MTTVVANILEVVVETEHSTTYTLALNTRNGVGIAFFVEEQLDLRWKPIPLPAVFANNPAFFQKFVASLAERGYVLDTPAPCN